MIYSLLDACHYVLAEQGEPQTSSWLASLVMELKLWRTSEPDVKDALEKDIQKNGRSSRFTKVDADMYALSTWMQEPYAAPPCGLGRSG